MLALTRRRTSRGPLRHPPFTVSSPASSDDPLNHKAESHGYLSSSAWVTTYYRLPVPSHCAAFCAKEHMRRFEEVGGKMAQTGISLHSTERYSVLPLLLKIGCRGYRPFSLRPLDAGFQLSSSCERSVLCVLSPSAREMCDNRQWRTLYVDITCKFGAFYFASECNGHFFPV